MGTRSRHSNIAVKSNLEDKTFQFDFHQAVELLQQMQPDATPLGEGNDPSKEALIIKTRISLSPSSSEIHSFSLPSANQHQPVLWVNFMGIAGIQGPLPTPYTELILERNRQHDTGFRDFLDIFNHRLASIWHRLKKRTFISFSQKDPRQTKIGQCLMSISGLGNTSYRDLIYVPERTLLSYHDLLWRRPKSAYGLIKVLKSYFNVPITIMQHQGAWIKAPDQDCSKLGHRLGKNNALGTEIILGRKNWNQAAGIRIDMGPLTWQQMNHMLPKKINDENGKLIAGRDFETLKDLIHFYIGMDYRVKIRFIVHPVNVKPLRLNRKFALGYNSWITVGKKLKTPCSVDICL